jgi:hypothetical protein
VATVKGVGMFKYWALGGKYMFGSLPDNEDERENFEARSETKAKALNELIQDMLTGKRSADDRWYQEFRIEATESRLLRVDPKELAIVLRVHHLSEVLALARKGILKWAREYAKEVLDAARKKDRSLMTRLELHETARDEIMPLTFKGNLFCVPLMMFYSAGTTQYACATSPLLVAGTVELRAIGRWGQKGELTEKQQHQRRGQFKTPWCYGGIKGQPLFGARRSRAALDPSFDFDSPYELDVPPKAAGKHSSFLGTKASTANWLKCSGFQYSDASWEAALPLPEPKRPVQKAAGGAAGGGGNLGNAAAGVKSNDPDHEVTPEDRKDAMEKAGDMMEKVGPILKAILQTAAPDLANIEARLRDAAQVGAAFVEGWRKKLVDKMQPLWKTARQKLDDTEQAVTQKSNELLAEWQKRGQAQDEARAEWQSTDIEVASDPKNPNLAKLKEKANEKKEKWQAAGQALKQLNNWQPLEDAKKALKVASTEAQKLQLPSEAVNAIVEELSTELSTRVMGFLKPIVGSLVEKGFGYIRSILEPILGAVIGAIGSIPFVGGALAVLAQVAFTVVMDMLKDAVTNGVLGLAEGFIAKLVRQVVGPLFRFVKEKLIAMVHSACAAFPGVCPSDVAKLRFAALPPKDRWLERVLACKSAAPLIGDWELKEAAHARVELQRLGRDMKENAVVYAMGFANRTLAQHGFTYKTFMAAARAPTADFVARAHKLARVLGERVVASRAKAR